MENSGLGQLLDVERAPGCQTCRPGNVCHCPGPQTSILGLRGARAPGPKAAFWVSLLWVAFRASGSSWMSNVQAGKRVALPWVSDEHCRPQSSFSCWPQGSILGLGLLLDVKRAGRETWLIPLSKFRPRNPDSGNCSFYRQDADVLSNSFLSHIFGRHNCLSEG